MKELQMWLATTRALKMQNGCPIHRCAKDDLNMIFNELTEEQLSAEDSVQVVVRYIKNALAECQGRRMPKAFEKLTYSDDTKPNRD
eukprot:7130303-Pyramimonas_sp.AAC.1